MSSKMWYRSPNTCFFPHGGDRNLLGVKTPLPRPLHPGQMLPNSCTTMKSYGCSSPRQVMQPLLPAPIHAGSLGRLISALTLKASHTGKQDGSWENTPGTGNRKGKALSLLSQHLPELKVGSLKWTTMTRFQQVPNPPRRDGSPWGQLMAGGTSPASQHFLFILIISLFADNQDSTHVKPGCPYGRTVPVSLQGLVTVAGDNISLRFKRWAGVVFTNLMHHGFLFLLFWSLF